MAVSCRAWRTLESSSTATLAGTSGVPQEQGDLGYLVIELPSKKKYILIQFQVMLQCRGRKYGPRSQTGRMRPRKHHM